MPKRRNRSGRSSHGEPSKSALKYLQKQIELEKQRFKVLRQQARDRFWRGVGAVARGAGSLARASARGWKSALRDTGNAINSTARTAKKLGKKAGNAIGKTTKPYRDEYKKWSNRRKQEKQIAKDAAEKARQKFRQEEALKALAKDHPELFSNFPELYDQLTKGQQVKVKPISPKLPKQNKKQVESQVKKVKQATHQGQEQKQQSTEELLKESGQLVPTEITVDQYTRDGKPVSRHNKRVSKKQESQNRAAHTLNAIRNESTGNRQWKPRTERVISRSQNDYGFSTITESWMHPDDQKEVAKQQRKSAKHIPPQQQDII